MDPTSPNAPAPDAAWTEISEKQAGLYYRIPPEIVRMLAVAEGLQFTVYAKKKNRIRPLNGGEKPLERSVLFRIAGQQKDQSPDDRLEALVRRNETPAYHACLRAMQRNLSDVLQEELEHSGQRPSQVATLIDYSGRRPRVTLVEERVGKGTAIGKRAPDFSLQNQDDQTVHAGQVWAAGPVLVVFYPGDFAPICTKQLCTYHDQFEEYGKYGLTILGISDNGVPSHKRFAETYKFGFPLLSDPNKRVAKLFGATSILMLGAISRAVFIINKGGIILYRYVEPTILTHRKAEELLGIVRDLDAAKLLDPTKKDVA